MFASTRAIWTLMAGSRVRYGAAIAALVAASCFLYLAPLVPEVVIDFVLLDRGDPSTLQRWALDVLGGAAGVRARPWVPALVLAGLTAAGGAFTYLRGRLSAQATESIVRRLRERVYDHLQRLPCAFFDRMPTGDLVQRCTSDVETVRVFLRDHVVEIGRAVVMLLVPLPVMLAIDPAMTAASVAVVPLIVGFSAAFFVRVRRAFTAQDEAEGRMTTTIQENLTGIRVVRAFARQDWENERFAGHNDEHQRRSERVYRLMAWFWSSAELLSFAQIVLVVMIGVARLSRGELAPGAFFYFLTAVGMFVHPVRMMGRIVADLGKTVVALGRIREILEAPAEAGPARPRRAGECRGELAFEGVSFAYPDGAEVLHDVTFRIAARETVALVGASGAGKSTVVALLMRLYDPDAGTVRLDGIDVRDLDLVELRRALAVVMQQPFLYSRTIADNLRLARGDATHEQIVEATRAACVHGSVEAFEAGYDTEVGERGVTLSGGQRQRLALARALLQRPAVLVLDDALSAVDTATETSILDALRRRRGRQTTLVIAHRRSTLALADRVLVLEHGRVVEEGTHAALLARGGPYARMWREQSRIGGVAPHEGT